MTCENRHTADEAHLPGQELVRVFPGSVVPPSPQVLLSAHEARREGVAVKLLCPCGNEFEAVWDGDELPILCFWCTKEWRKSKNPAAWRKGG